MEEKTLPTRKSPRLKNFDYSRGGAYFLTICTHDRKRILSTIGQKETIKPVGEGFALPQLTQTGQIMEYWLNKISEHFQNAEIGEYVIMPNHIHIILFLEDTSGRADPSPTVSNVIGWLKYNVTKAVNLPKGEKLFQRSFYDRIIRDRDEYMEICNYVALNPQNWETDELYI